jgi:hypothetical protein
MDNEKIVLSATNSFDLVNFSESPSISLNLSKSEKRCMEDISILSFHRGSGDNFDHIQIESGFITFESLNGRNMITYSHECKNPKKEYPKADYREYRFIKIEKIGIMLKQSKQSFV